MGEYETTHCEPVPAARQAPLNFAAMPFDRMQVGESFLVPLPGGRAGTLGRKLWAAACRHGIRVRVKKGAAGLRVWRVA